MKTTTTTSPRIYVGTYAKYTSGSIAGKWLDLEDYSDRDEFLEACAELHKDESDPELMFQDYEGFPAAWYSESSAPPDILWEWIGLDESERAAFAVYADHMGGDVDIDGFRDAYQGCWTSEADFAQHMAEECECVPKDLASWIVIDWQASWDSGLRFDYFTGRDENGDLYIFRNC